MLTRNNVVWTIGKVAGVLGFIAAHFGWFHFPPNWQPWIELMAVFVGGGSAALGSSPLPHSQSPNKEIEWARLIVDKPLPPSGDFIGAAALPGPGPSSHSASR